MLGSPLLQWLAMDDSFSSRCADLERAVDRLQHVSAHDALLLLKNCLTAPKLQHTLRSSCCQGHELLAKFDNLQRSALCHICNVFLSDDQWIQASLPFRNGGLGIRRVSSLAPSAFLASAAGTRPLQDQILRRTDSAADVAFDRCLSTQLNLVNFQPPEGIAAAQQRAWDQAVVVKEYDDLLNRYSEPYHRARLLAAAPPPQWRLVASHAVSQLWSSLG